jgi:membrane peptidoglycan carboxypeptidase
LTQKIGIPQVIAAARDLGLRAPLHNNPSLALGTSEVSLIDLTSAYAAVRAGKAPVDPHGISGIKLGDDNDYMPVAQSVAQHSLGQYQGQLISLLQGVISHGTGRAAALNGFAAGKTGTSQDYRDAWFIGFDDHLVVGVWVGNDDHSPMKRVTGGSLPAAIWKQFMEQAGPVVAAASAPPPSLSSESAHMRQRTPSHRTARLVRAAKRSRKRRARNATFPPASRCIIRSAPPTAPISPIGAVRDAPATGNREMPLAS